MNKSNWNYPTTVWFGEGRIKDLHLACSQLKIKKPLFITDIGLGQSEMVKEIVKDLNNKSFSTSVTLADSDIPTQSLPDECMFRLPD